MRTVDFKLRSELMKLIPDHVAAWQAGNKEPLINLRIELGRRYWNLKTTERGLSIGEPGSSFTRQVYIVNPDQREFYTRDKRNGPRSYVLTFGAYGSTHLLVYTDSLEDALEECASWLAEHAPGHIMAFGSEEHIELIKEACEEHGVPFDPDKVSGVIEEPYDRVLQDAESDLTYTESGFLTSHEWFVSLENPDTETLYRYIHGE